MLSAFTNAFKIEELRKRIVFTLCIVIITRIGAAIPVPGVDASALATFFKSQEETHGGSILALLNIFSGGALEHLAIFSLTIMPYISASIIFQLLTAVIPQLSKLAREEGGRQKITQYTRYGTVVIAVFQAYMFAKTFENPRNLPMFRSLPPGIEFVHNPGFGFEFVAVMTLTCGTIFMMWLGEQITERGIGNGISMLIATNILAKFPGAIAEVYRMLTAANAAIAWPIQVLLYGGLFAGVIMAVIVVTQAQRKISVQYAQRMVGRKMYAGGQNYMPLKVNYSGVMPIIFAQAILMFPQTIASCLPALLSPNSRLISSLNWISARLQEGGLVHLATYGIMIFFFSYFWVATVFNPIQIADDLKKHGGYVPGVRPGKPTADFLDFTMTRITFAGAVFLTIVATLPIVLTRQFSINYLVASFFGGTSLLIIVGVLLDTLRQIETHLLTRNYEGFLKKGRLRGRI